MRRLRVLVCGSNYGRIYFEALRLKSERYEPVGLLARGSERSQKLAGNLRVPLFRTVHELPGRIDLACVALGAAAGDVVLDLLRRGIHVLCEHPRRPDFLKAALETAAAGGAVFHVNAHFGALPAARAFIQEAQERCEAEPPLFLEAMATDRSLYSLLDIVGQALGRLETAGFSRAGGEDRPLVTLRGRLGGVPALFEVQGALGKLPDGSPEYIVDHRVALGFSEGVLTLLSVSGPVVWNHNLGRAPGGPLWQPVYLDVDVTARSLHEMRVLVNLEAIELLASHAADGNAPVFQSPEHMLGVSRSWERLSAALSGRRGPGTAPLSGAC